MEQGRKYKFRSEQQADFVRSPSIEGRVVKLDVHDVEGEARRYIVIDTGVSLIRVYESSALTDAFEAAQEGDGIYLEHRGKVSLLGGKTYNRFDVSLWDWNEDYEKKRQAKESTAGAQAND